jgi:hypothetical protein
MIATMTIETRRLIALGIALAGLSLTGITSTAGAHPHDLLAQCRLPDGKWVMCDQTVHDTLSSEHVKKAGKPDKLTTAPRGQ